MVLLATRPHAIAVDFEADLTQYFAQGRDPARFADAEDVRDAFHDHRDFLITSMLEGQEGIDWNDTPMLNYFQLKFPVRHTLS